MGAGPEIGGGATGNPPTRLGPLADLYGSGLGAPRHTPESIWRHWTADVWRDRVRRDYDNVLVVTGDPGCGKSTLAIQIARALDRRFDLTSLAYRASELLDAIDRMRRGQCIIFDEAILGLMGREFATEEARAVVKTLNVTRFLGINTIVCIPNIWDLDVALRGRRTDFWLTCSYDPRGEADVHERSRVVRYRRDGSLGLYKSRAWSPIRWQPLPPPLWAEYLAQKTNRVKAYLRETRARLDRSDPLLRKEHRERERDERTRSTQDRDARIRQLRGGGLSYDEICEELGVDRHTIRRAILRGGGGALSSA